MPSIPEHCIDLARYPITSLDSPDGQALIADCRHQLGAQGVCLLHDFIRPEMLASIVGETEALIPLAHHYASTTTTAYQETVAMEQRTGHPRNTPRTSSNHVLAYDLIPATSVLRQLYESDAVLRFIAAVVGATRLYRYADALGALNIAVNMPGDHNGWHFDQCDFVTSLLLREAESGGRFEYSAHVRNRHDENYPAVRRILAGDRDGVAVLPMKAGSLSIFKGRDSLHRVTQIAGTKPRLIALLGYDTQPGVWMTESARLRRFGRTA